MEHSNKLGNRFEQTTNVSVWRYPLRPNSIHLLFVLLFLSTWVVHSLFLKETAQGAEEPAVTRLDPVVVTASTQPTRLSHTAASVKVITRAQIERQQANRLSEILQQIPGLFIDEMGGRGGISSVYFRGGDPNMTLIMIDGARINDPTNQRGGSVDLSTLTPERIERIEVIRGPLSALYGSEAMSGVINIVTRSGQRDFHYLGRAAVGRFGYTREILQASGPIWNLRPAISLSYARNDEQVEGDGFQLGTAGWNVSLNKDWPVRAQLTGKFLQTKSRAFPEGSGGPRFALLRETEKQDTQELVSALHISHSFSPTWQQDFFFNFLRREQDVDNPGVLSAPNIFAIPPNTFETNYTRLQPRWTQTISLLQDWSLTGGIQLVNEIATRTGIQQISATGIGPDQPIDFNQSRLIAATFFELATTFFSNIDLIGGMRLDLPERFQQEISPRVAAKYQLTPSFGIRAGYGEGFKLPSFTSLGDPIIGNPSLLPETNIGWDVGINHFMSAWNTMIELTYFQNQFSNLIDLDPDLARQGVFRLTNLRTVTTQGIELEIQATVIPELFLKGFFTYLNTDIRGSSDSLRNRPKFSGGLIFTVQPTQAWTFRGQIRAVGKRFDLQIPTPEDQVGGFAVADLAVTYRPSNSWRLFGVIDNLTNTTYEEFLGFPAPPISFRLGLEFRS